MIDGGFIHRPAEGLRSAQLRARRRAQTLAAAAATPLPEVNDDTPPAEDDRSIRQLLFDAGDDPLPPGKRYQPRGWSVP